MRYEIKNTANQPLLIVVGGETVQLNARKSMQISEKDYGPQLKALKARRLLRVTRR